MNTPSKLLATLSMDDKGRITLPQRVREALGLEPGSQVRVEQDAHGHVELVPAITVPVDQLWYHGIEGRARLTAAEADINAGRVTRVTSEEELVAYLADLKTRPLAQVHAQPSLASSAKGNGLRYRVKRAGLRVQDGEDTRVRVAARKSAAKKGGAHKSAAKKATGMKKSAAKKSASKKSATKKGMLRRHAD